MQSIANLLKVFCFYLLIFTFHLVVILVQINGSNSVFFPNVLDKSVELTNDHTTIAIAGHVDEY